MFVEKGEGAGRILIILKYDRYVLCFINIHLKYRRLGYLE